MAGIRRKIIWVIGLSLLVLVGMGVYSYFVGTRTLLEHAEAFAFRRMTVSQLADQGDFRFFFATNRTFGLDEGPVEERFSAERSSQLHFGSFDTGIEPTLGLGMIIDASRWFVNEEIRLSGVRLLAQEQFLADLRQQVEASPRRSLLMVVHGFREAFPSALRKTAFLGHILDIDTPVLVFDWPGNQGGSLRGYRRARRVADASGAELAAMLKLVMEEIQPQRLWLLANSMGGEVVAQAFSDLNGDPGFAPVQTKIEDVVLTAPDVDREEFNDQFKQEISALARHTTVYVSSNDRALLVSRLLNRGMRLGESSLDPSNPDQVAQAAELAKLLEPDDDRLALVDVTAVNRTRNFHNFSLETPEFFDDLFLRLTGDGLPETRELYSLKTPEGARYFVLTRAR